MIETERLVLREYTLQDFDEIYEILSDSETMQHYPSLFLKETDKFIGDCEITIQNIDGELLSEIGFHIHKKYWRRDLGSEVARAVRDWAFQNTKYDCLYSYMKYTNIASYFIAVANGMKKEKEYPDEKNGISYMYTIKRAEWEKLK